MGELPRYRSHKEVRALEIVGVDEEHDGEYLFTVAPVGDGFSASPDQAKEFSFVALESGRLTVQPTNRVLFREASFTRNAGMVFPRDLRRQVEVWRCE